MSIDLMIHILEALILFSLAVCICIVYAISQELKRISIKLNDRLIEIEGRHQREEEYKKEYIERQKKIVEKIIENVDKAIKDRNTLNVVDKPLDFPNDNT